MDAHVNHAAHSLTLIQQLLCNSLVLVAGCVEALRGRQGAAPCGTQERQPVPQDAQRRVRHYHGAAQAVAPGPASAATAPAAHRMTMREEGGWCLGRSDGRMTRLLGSVTMPLCLHHPCDPACVTPYPHCARPRAARRIFDAAG